MEFIRNDGSQDPNDPPPLFYGPDCMNMVSVKVSVLLCIILKNDTDILKQFKNGTRCDISGIDNMRVTKCVSIEGVKL